MAKKIICDSTSNSIQRILNECLSYMALECDLSTLQGYAKELADATADNTHSSVLTRIIDTGIFHDAIGKVIDIRSTDIRCDITNADVMIVTITIETEY